MEAAAAEAMLNAGAEAEARAEAGEAEAVSAAEAGRGAGGVGGTVAEAGVVKIVAACNSGWRYKAGDAVGAWRLGFEMNPGEKCWWTMLDSSAVEAVDGPVRLVEALKAFAISVEVAGLMQPEGRWSAAH